VTFHPGQPLPRLESDTTPGTLYHAVTATLRIVIFQRTPDGWRWSFVAGHRPDGAGDWADVQAIVQGKQDQPGSR